MISFALGELKCPSLEYVYNMTWAEFRIRLHAWERIEEKELFLLRELAWVTYIAPHQDPKKMKKSKDSFWRLKRKGDNALNERMKSRMKEAIDKYKEEIKQKNG